MSLFVRTLCALPAIAFATGAYAHVTLEIREAKAGSSYKAVLKIPHGCDSSAIVKLRAEIPEGLVAVKIETVRGAPAPALIILAQAVSGESKTFKVGGITVQAPWSRATPGGAQVAGGYMKITNDGKDADRLTGGTFPNAARFEIHEMKTEGSVVTMRPLPKGLEIKPGETVEFKPGGYHLMFMGLKQGLKEGQTVKGTLTFDKAGTIDVEYRVGPVGGGAPAAGGHKHQH